MKQKTDIKEKQIGRKKNIHDDRCAKEKQIQTPEVGKSTGSDGLKGER